MSKNLPSRLLALSVCLILLLSACASGEKAPDNAQASGSSSALTWTRWNGFDSFLELASQAYPEVEWEFTAYAEANRTGYNWAQMRADGYFYLLADHRRGSGKGTSGGLDQL